MNYLGNCHFYSKLGFLNMDFIKVVRNLCLFFVMSTVSVYAEELAFYIPNVPDTGLYFSPNEELCSDLRVGCDAFSYPLRIYGKHAEGKWFGDSSGYTTLGLFSTIPQKTFYTVLPIIDLRGHFFNNRRTASNIGAGLRYLKPSDHLALGANLFYDYREGSFKHGYHQMGVGLEWLSLCFDVRINGYIPIGKVRRNSEIKKFKDIDLDAVLDSGFKATCQQHQSAMYGADVEIGKWLKRRNPCDRYDFNVYGAIGGYTYLSHAHDQRIYGADARLMSNFGRYFSFEVKGGWDQIFHRNIQASFTIAFPMVDPCFSRTTQMYARSPYFEDCFIREIALQPIYRQEIITLDDKECCWTWNWPTPECESCVGN